MDRLAAEPRGGSQAESGPAAAIAGLYWRTGHGGVGVEDAAIAWPGLQDLAASLHSKKKQHASVGMISIVQVPQCGHVSSLEHQVGATCALCRWEQQRTGP